MNDISNWDFDQILQTVFKDFFILGGIIYIVFAVVVIRQIAIMKKTLITPISPIIQLLGYIHLALAVFVLFFFIAVLP